MQDNNFSIFVADNKLADIIRFDFRILNILTRCEIPLGFGEKTIQEVCDVFNRS